MDTVVLPPVAPILIEATRAIGYSVETAIADIVDNSLAANAIRVEINFFPFDNPYMAILDNGIGMDSEELIQAMRFGSKDPLGKRTMTDLGRFGLGMKTASLSQCRKLTVVSKQGGALSAAQWDLDVIDKSGDWSLGVLDLNDIVTYPYIERLVRYDSGTLVIWQNLDRMNLGESDAGQTMGARMDRVRDHLSLVFHRYLRGEQGLRKVEILINDLNIDATDPFLTGKSMQVMDEEIINVNGHKVIVRPYTLPHISLLSEKEIKRLGGKEGLRKQQGFYIYRNKRLLVWGTWFRLMRRGELSKLARVQIDVPNALDYLWALDIKKSLAVPPEVVRKSLGVIIDKIADSSKKTWVFRGKRETNDADIHIWSRYKSRDGGVVYEVNRDHPLVEALSALGTNEKLTVEQLLVQIERFLPLNQLYIDLTSDMRITNESEIAKDDVVPLFKHLLDSCKDLQQREALVARLSVAEPFNQHPEWLRMLWQEGE